MTGRPEADGAEVAAWDDMVLVGRLGRSHGLRGDVLLQSETDFPDLRFAAGATVYARRDGAVVALEVERFRMHADRPLVAFRGFETIEAIEALGHGELRVPETALTPLPDGEHYWFRYVGAPVRTEAGQEIGTVLRVEPTGSTGVLIVGRGEEEVQIPLTPALCPVLGPDLIVVRPPDGLLDLNTPGPGKSSAHRHRDNLPRPRAGRNAGRRGRPGGGRGRR